MSKAYTLGPEPSKKAATLSGSWEVKKKKKKKKKNEFNFSKSEIQRPEIYNFSQSYSRHVCSLSCRETKREFNFSKLNYNGQSPHS